MVFRTSLRGLVIWLCVAGVLGLVFYSSATTDPGCPTGYVESGPYTCETSDGMQLARFFGANFALAAISLLWSVVKQSRAQSRFVRRPSFQRTGTALGSWTRAETYDSEGQTRARPNAPRMIHYQTQSFDSEAQPPINSREPLRDSSRSEPSEVSHDLASEARDTNESFHESQVSPEVASSGTSMNVGAEEFDFETFVLPQFVREVSSDELVENLAKFVPNFDVSQASLTALRMVSVLELKWARESVDPLQLVGLFRSGYQIGCLVYNVELSAQNIIDVPSNERDQYFEAVQEDSDYFLNVEPSDLERSFSGLPVSVRYWFHRRADELTSGGDLEGLHSACLRLFLSGLAFVAFSAKDLKRA
jgi:hypothetical protein